MRSLVRGAVLLGLALALGLAAAAPAAAPVAETPQWLPPEDVTSSAGAVASPSLATDALGTVFVLWAGDEGRILSTARPAQVGAWEDPQPLSAPGAASPRLAVTRAGTAIAVWVRSGLVEAAVRPPGGEWGPAETISNVLDSSQSPRVSVDAAGNAYAVWARAFNGDASIKARFRRADTGLWDPPEDVPTGPEPVYQPELAVSARGDAIFVWKLESGYLLSSFRSADDHVWAARQTIAPGGDITGNDYATVALDDDGNAVVVFEHRVGFNAGVVASTRPITTGQWSEWVPIGGGSNGSTALAFDPAGNATAVWQGGGSQSIIQGAVLPPGGSWSTAETLSQGITHRWPAVAVAGVGTAVAVWQRTTQPPPPPPAGLPLAGLEYAAQAAVRPPGGVWQRFGDISLAGVAADYITVAADPAGNGIALWRRPGDFLQTAAYDGAGPVLDELSIPAHGDPGVPVSFSVSPFDVWSALAGEATWSFGDGAEATGNQVSHTYAEGSYVVTVRAEDSLANESSASAK